MKAFTFAIFLTLAVAFAAASEDTEIDDALLGHLDADTEDVTDLESQEKTSWGSRRAKRYITRKHYKCHYNQNWVNGLKYSQKVIKASSRRAAAQMCVNDCAKRKGCTGFFYQKHKNGHQICGFYSSKIGAGTWHGHAEGAVCRHYKTTRHEVKGQVAEAEEFLADAEAPETEVDDVEEEQSLSRWPYVVRSGRDCIGGAFKCGHGSLHTAYRACEASRHCGAVAFRGNHYCLKHPVRRCRQDYRNGYKMYKKPPCPNYRMMAPRRVDCKHGAYKCGASYSECDAKRKCAGDRRCGGVSVSPNGKHYCLKHKKRHCSKDYRNKYTFFTK